jgi:two-component system sensor histidine kinase BarA
MMININHLPVIDWDQAIRISGQKKELATQILELLIKDLKNDFATIEAAYDAQNYPEMLRLVHKLHGALCYCGVPRLKTVVASIETNIKNNIMESLPFLVSALNTEVNLLLERSSLHDIHGLQEP